MELNLDEGESTEKKEVRLSDLKKTAESKQPEFPIIPIIEFTKYSSTKYSSIDPDALKLIVRVGCGVVATLFVILMANSIKARNPNGAMVEKNWDYKERRTFSRKSQYERDLDYCVKHGLEMGFSEDIARETCGAR